MSNTLIVNGVRIETNKEIARISNARIDFKDGSYCDVSTNTVVSMGRGYITLIGGANADYAQEDVCHFPEVAFYEQSLSIGSMPCAVKVYGSDEPGIKISMHGPKDVVEKIRWHAKDDVLTIHANGNYPFPVFDLNNASSPADIDQAQLEGEAVLKFVVSKGMAISVVATSRPVTINDVSGDVDIRVAGSAEVVVDAIESGRLELTGSGEITIGEAQGNITATMTGSGSIDINGGSIDRLSVQLTGSGDFTCHAEVDEAKLKLTGSGTIEAVHIKNIVSGQKSGSGDIITR